MQSCSTQERTGEHGTSQVIPVVYCHRGNRPGTETFLGMLTYPHQLRYTASPWFIIIINYIGGNQKIDAQGFRNGLVWDRNSSEGAESVHGRHPRKSQRKTDVWGTGD